MYKAFCLLLLLTAAAVTNAKWTVPENIKDIGWLVGKWRSEFGGKLNWPTVPTMTYGEELEFWPGPYSYGCGGTFLNFTARGWSHSTKDHFLDSYGYLTMESSGDATFFTVGNNGFLTMEVGKAKWGYINLKLKDIGRIQIARDLPVEDLYRQFRLVDYNTLEQVLLMRTATHPSDKTQLLEHSRVTYNRMDSGGPDGLTTTAAPLVDANGLNGNSSIAANGTASATTPATSASSSNVTAAVSQQSNGTVESSTPAAAAATTKSGDASQNSAKRLKKN